MEVINTQPWAGTEFSHLPGEIIDLPDEVAAARIAAGLAAPVPAPKKGKAPVKTDEPKVEVAVQSAEAPKAD